MKTPDVLRALRQKLYLNARESISVEIVALVDDALTERDQRIAELESSDVEEVVDG